MYRAVVQGGSDIPRVSTPPRLWTEQEELPEGEGVGTCWDMIWAFPSFSLLSLQGPWSCGGGLVC